MGCAGGVKCEKRLAENGNATVAVLIGVVSGSRRTVKAPAAAIVNAPPFDSCFLVCRSKLVCCPKQRSQRSHLNGFSLLCMLRTCR
uniref:Secreted protein n=1 Tax=Brugia timori TaxID=42155 RepID=A0A0R3R0X4_9BILA